MSKQKAIERRLIVKIIADIIKLIIKQAIIYRLL